MRRQLAVLPHFMIPCLRLLVTPMAYPQSKKPTARDLEQSEDRPRGVPNHGGVGNTRRERTDILQNRS